ncbi:DMT family transporter [Candidatus Kuenenbacteria bacterium]|nr:DMT family transporter [Candidatus Kuenenbacteria bacterium]
MIWFWVVIISLFCNAGAQLLDKFLLTKKFPNASVLTFWTAIGNLLGIVFIFWEFNFFPGWYLFIIALLSGVAFTVALQFFYMGMKKGEASHIAPLVGGTVPVFTFIISYYWLAERLTFYHQIAVLLLVVGALLISFEKSKKYSGVHIGMLWAVIAGLFFALSYVMMRRVFLDETFSTGFVWARLGSFVAALPILFSKRARNMIFAKSEKQKEKAKSGLGILAVNKSLAALYFVGINYAMSLTSATLVNALAGLQYAILFIMIYISTKKLPKFFNEHFTRKEIVQQVVAILFIIGGLAFLVL